MRLVQALKRQPVDRTPVWFMRQAGRFLPEYRALREKYSFIQMCTDPELAVRTTLLPIHRFPGLDAAIIYSDILLIAVPMGIQIEYAAQEGPVIRTPITAETDVARLRPVDVRTDMKFVLDAIRAVRNELTVPLLGFAGAPFTLASYLIEGGSSQHYLKTKALMHTAPRVWHALMGKLAKAVVELLNAQIEAGAQAVQLFDSWAGALSPDDYREYVLPHSKFVFENVRGAPAIHFSTCTSGLLELLAEAGGDAIGVDWRIPLDAAWSRVPSHAIQGNLDPAALLAPKDELLRRVDAVLARAGRRPGHIFNLGHGVLPETPPDNVELVIERVHRA